MPIVWVGEAVGNTPAVLLRRLTSGKGNVMVKLEFMNPSGSIKDRPALYMIKEAEERGLLKPGSTIVEPSSGNTALSLAMLAAAKGYKMVAVVPETTSEQKVKMMELLGAKVIFSKAGVPLGHPEHHYTLAKRLAEENGWVMLDQYKNEANVRAHYETTGPEVLKQARELMGGLDAFVAGVGTGGTVIGVGKFLKERVKGVKVVAVVPKGTKIAGFFGSEGERLSHAIEGLTAMPVSELIKKYKHVIDEIIEVDDEEAVKTARELASKEGLLAGLSAGANVRAALELEREGLRVATVAPDGAIRYLERLTSRRS
ncbi:PLP-dependent cysteine synthase family protein [Ignicoccus hospitalis]|uniref:Pyridoxal-5'-phosphate-dependent enzyme, beta subunit n=1 Tax=Ignicoccus hospitalis (strain KIN4/I / DSM 18386 / JCM 14125) TaxID=453591 RepID=A8AA10_IGNH4|nr:cysteine synthase family protein [Ignicoccus hospitalis]ABU81762.1 Pyridoxal-5'-phosphate-dependent enzyme, beta subunit [Ignicoccus hospitalis KIN4/I]HIH90030.1 cysteine synthase family protein [Desulfurococcaceae archaeon]